MFIGHFAGAFAAKRVAPSVSLGTLFLAAQFADLLWPLLVLAGVERFAVEPGATKVTPLNFIHYPYSHSLLALSAWGILLGAAYTAARRAPWTAGLTLGLLVLSHWVLDFVTHRPDLPLTLADSPKLGLGLWNSLPATFAVEGLLFIAGVAFYATRTKAHDRAGKHGLWALVVFLSGIYLANLFGPPPPSVGAVVWTAQAMWLLVLWGFWVDRHRSAALCDAR